MYIVLKHETKNISCTYRVTVKGLVWDETGRLLFVRERGDTWDLPGGGLEHGEEIFEALRREFREELKVEIEIINTSPIVIPTWHEKFDDPVLILAYQVRLLGQPQATEEVEELRYFNTAEIATHKLDPALKGKMAHF